MIDSYSVVIPAYDAAATLGEAIDSVLRQTLLPSAIIVVDDGSTDDTARIARGYRDVTRVIVQANAGPGAATTRGLAEVATPFVGLLDADDLWLPEKARRQIEFIAADPRRHGAAVLGRLFRDGQPPHGDGPIQELWLRTGLMIRTESAHAVGPIIDPPGRRGDMVDWLKRAREQGLNVAMLREVLALRRVRPDSLSYGRGAQDAGYLHVVKAALDRRRARSGTGQP